jgi:hypothetical protein
MMTHHLVAFVMWIKHYLETFHYHISTIFEVTKINDYNKNNN